MSTDKKINSVVQIQTGIYAQTQPIGDVYYIQARHFDEHKAFISTIKPELPYTEKLEKHLLKTGDVLIAAKGYDHFAVTFTAMDKPAAASSMFIVLRIINTTQLLPEFLTWFLNHPNTQSMLAVSSKGTALPSISKTDIGDLIIPIPSIKQQQNILKIQSLQLQANNIQKQISNLKNQYIQQSILNTLK